MEFPYNYKQLSTSHDIKATTSSMCACVRAYFAICRFAICNILLELMMMVFDKGKMIDIRFFFPFFVFIFVLRDFVSKGCSMHELQSHFQLIILHDYFTSCLMSIRIHIGECILYCINTMHTSHVHESWWWYSNELQIGFSLIIMYSVLLFRSKTEENKAE